jgi:hypothetical protein
MNDIQKLACGIAATSAIVGLAVAVYVYDGAASVVRFIKGTR